MKNHFISLFESHNLRKTIILLIVATLLISVSLIIGTTDNLPMIAMLLAGMIFFCFTILHPWKKAGNFAKLAAIGATILIIDFILPFINERFAMGVGFICLVCIITGIIGIFTRLKTWSRLPYTASVLSLLALGILTVTVSSPPFKTVLLQGSDLVLIGIQLLITILLFVTGLKNNKGSFPGKAILLFSVIVLFVLCVGAFYISTWEFEEIAKGFTNIMIRIYAGIILVAAALALYACK